MLWTLAGLVGLVTVAPRIDQAVDTNRQGETSVGFAIQRAPDGQFYTDARLNGMTVRMMVDPGADRVLLSGDDAERLGIAAGPGFTPVTLPRLAVGSIEVERVEAVVAPELPVSLIGRSYLARLTGYRVESDRMLLR